MNKIIKYTAILFILFAGCKKENNTFVYESVYNASSFDVGANRSNVLLHKIIDSSNGDVFDLYGSTDNTGQETALNAISANIGGNSDTVYFYTLENNAVKSMYWEINGVKDRYEQQIEYINADSLTYAIYDVFEDTLINLIGVSIDGDKYTPTVLYGKTQNIFWDAIVQNLDIVGGVVLTVVIVVGAPVLIPTITATQTALAAGSFALYWFSNTAEGAEMYGIPNKQFVLLPTDNCPFSFYFEDPPKMYLNANGSITGSGSSTTTISSTSRYRIVNENGTYNLYMNLVIENNLSTGCGIIEETIILDMRFSNLVVNGDLLNDFYDGYGNIYKNYNIQNSCVVSESIYINNCLALDFDI